ncbi:hypothetical protein [Hungatella hathewayi]|uniref:hypothetical protein n=1 Tax=Hungatella hathewayi TaxID=154046 RepID=UPI00356282C6
MRDLSVYFCKKCGFYSYYPLSKYAVCPRCDLDMMMLPIEYKEFVSLDCNERDELLANLMIASSASIVQRIIAPHKINNTREIIAILTYKIDELNNENVKLKGTVDWMHQFIWQLLKNRKNITPP